MAEFRYLRKEGTLKVGDFEIEDDGTGEGRWVAPKEVVWGSSLASFRRAMRNYAEDWNVNPAQRDTWKNVDAAFGELYVSLAEADDFSVDYSDRFQSSLCVLAGGVSAVTVEIAMHGADLEEDDFERLLAPLLSRHGSRFLEVSLHGEGNQVYAVLRLSYDRRGATIGDAVEFSTNVERLLDAMRGGSLTAETAFMLVAAGRADLLIGQPESSWLEVKSQGYELTGHAGRIELGQDVARFANGDTAGLLVVGLRTAKSRHGAEVISKLTPSLTSFSSAQHHKAIDDRVFPPLLGLEVQQVQMTTRSGSGGYLLAILVPRQPEESKPVLVHGAIVEGKTEGAFISIVQRRGEHSVPVSPQSIHATLAAGRALLRRGQLPV